MPRQRRWVLLRATACAALFADHPHQRPAWSLAALGDVEARATRQLDACNLTAAATRPVLVTCFDSYYASSAEVWAAHHARLGWKEQVMVALDRETHERATRIEGVCAVPFFPESNARGGGAIPPLTGLSKFWVADALLAAGVPSLVSEMDVYPFADAYAVLLRAGWNEPTAPAILAQRARRNLAVNIGFFAVQPRAARAREAAELFRKVLDEWRREVVASAGADGETKAVDQQVFNTIRYATDTTGCVRRWGSTSKRMLEAPGETNCSATVAPLLATFDTDVVSQARDVMATTVVWHVHPGTSSLQRRFMGAMYSGNYTACCRAKLRERQLTAAGVALNASTDSTRFCGRANVGKNPDDMVCHRFDATWLAAMVATGYEPRHVPLEALGLHTLCDLEKSERWAGACAPNPGIVDRGGWRLSVVKADRSAPWIHSG